MAKSKRIGVVWFRQDLRLSDNPALRFAAAECDELILLFIADPADGSVGSVGSASSVWLHHSLAKLTYDLSQKGLTLRFAKGASGDILNHVVDCTGASTVYWNRCYDPQSIRRDKSIKSELSARVSVQSFNALLLFEPFETLKSDGTPYRVFTPFWKMLSTTRFPVDKPVRLPRTLPGDAQLSKARINQLNTLATTELQDLKLLPVKPWADSMMSHWHVGEKAAMKTLRSFIKSSLAQYNSQRDVPGVEGTSMLSPHLHFGEISPRQVIALVLGSNQLEQLSVDELTFVKEVVWREFAYSLLYHFPETVDKPLDKRFEQFAWAPNTDDHFKAWCLGQTGVPIVDAGMRQLYATGWMHNRVRMIVGSYLIKNLLIPWQRGERWFRDTLVDADMASNVMGWQWCSGSGADAAPFFRIFNPVLQGEKFDQQGDYVKRWVPELEGVTAKFIHKPWELSDSERSALDYPPPLVDLKVSRQRALDAFSAIKS
ncbi:MAG: DNA photolyase family protein [Gammaproteobacteria bacterium]|nr:DNA photolyase family protein [Gammaproteobacteria bacterium]